MFVLRRDLCSPHRRHQSSSYKSSLPLAGSPSTGELVFSYPRRSTHPSYNRGTPKTTYSITSVHTKIIQPVLLTTPTGIIPSHTTCNTLTSVSYRNGASYTHTVLPRLPAHTSGGESSIMTNVSPFETPTASYSDRNKYERTTSEKYEGGLPFEKTLPRFFLLPRSQVFHQTIHALPAEPPNPECVPLLPNVPQAMKCLFFSHGMNPSVR